MRHTLLSLRPIAVCFLLFPLHAPDGKCAHKQNIDQRQTPIAVQNAEEGIQGEIAVVVQIISPQRHDAVAHQKRQHDERGGTFRRQPLRLLPCVGEREAA